MKGFKNFIRHFGIFLLILMSSLYLHSPIFAQSSVAAIAEIAAYEAGIVAGGTAPIVAASSATIAGVGTSSGSFVGAGIAIVSGGALVVAGLTVSTTNQLRNTAFDKYCEQNPTSQYCGDKYYLVRSDCSLDTTNLIPASFIFSQYFANGQKTENTWCPQLSSHIYFVYNTPSVMPGEGISLPAPSGYYSASFGPPIKNRTKWEDLPQSIRDAATSLLNAADYAGALVKGTALQIPPGLSNVPIALQNIASLFRPNSYNSDGTINENSNSTTNLGGQAAYNMPNPYFSNGGSGGTGGSGGGGNPPDPSPSPSPDPSPSPSPSPSPDPSPSPSPDSDSCALVHPETHGTLADAANMLASILPQTPTNMRLPTLIANMGGQGSLAGNLGLELYSAAWQYFSVIAFVKFYKLIPGKMS
jgi:hypothetical protein